MIGGGGGGGGGAWSISASRPTTRYRGTPPEQRSAANVGLL